MKIKILEFNVIQGSKRRVQSHNLRKGKWKINPNYEMHEMLIENTPQRFTNIKRYTIEK